MNLLIDTRMISATIYFIKYWNIGASLSLEDVDRYNIIKE
jgi:hypothetical protein